MLTFNHLFMLVGSHLAAVLLGWWMSSALLRNRFSPLARATLSPPPKLGPLGQSIEDSDAAALTQAVKMFANPSFTREDFFAPNKASKEPIPFSARVPKVPTPLGREVVKPS